MALNDYINNTTGNDGIFYLTTSNSISLEDRNTLENL